MVFENKVGLQWAWGWLQAWLQWLQPISRVSTQSRDTSLEDKTQLASVPKITTAMQTWWNEQIATPPAMSSPAPSWPWYDDVNQNIDNKMLDLDRKLANTKWAMFSVWPRLGWIPVWWWAMAQTPKPMDLLAPDVTKEAAQDKRAAGKVAGLDESHPWIIAAKEKMATEEEQARVVQEEAIKNEIYMDSPMGKMITQLKTKLPEGATEWMTDQQILHKAYTEMPQFKAWLDGSLWESIYKINKTKDWYNFIYKAEWEMTPEQQEQFDTKKKESANPRWENLKIDASQVKQNMKDAANRMTLNPANIYAEDVPRADKLNMIEDQVKYFGNFLLNAWAEAWNLGVGFIPETKEAIEMVIENPKWVAEWVEQIVEDVKENPEMLADMVANNPVATMFALEWIVQAPRMIASLNKAPAKIKNFVDKWKNVIKDIKEWIPWAYDDFVKVMDDVKVKEQEFKAAKTAEKVEDVLPDDVKQWAKTKIDDAQDIAGRIVQWETKDILPTLNALADIDTKWIKTYKELSSKMWTSERALMKAVDVITDADASLYKADDLIKTVKVWDSTVSQEFVWEGLKHLKEMYNKINDPVGEARISNMITKYADEWLNLTEINAIAREYSSAFGRKAFNKMWDPLTSVNAQAFENVRKWIKEAMRDKLPTKEAKALDQKYANIAKAKARIDKIVEQTNKLNQKIKKRTFLEKVGRITGKVIDWSTWWFIRWAFTSVLPSNVGNKVMNAIDIEAALSKNLKKLERIIKKTEDWTIKIEDLSWMFPDEGLKPVKTTTWQPKPKVEWLKGNANNSVISEIATELNLPPKKMLDVKEIIDNGWWYVEIAEKLNLHPKEAIKVKNVLEGMKTKLKTKPQWLKWKEWVDVGITSVKWFENQEIDKLVDAAALLEKQGKFKDAEKLYKQSIELGKDILKQELWDDIVSMEWTVWRYFGESEPTIALKVKKADDATISKLIDISENKFKQKSMFTAEKAPIWSKIWIIDKKSWLSNEPWIIIKTKKKIELEKAKDLDTIFNNLDIPWATILPNGEWIKIYNLSAFETNYGKFQDSIEWLIKKLQKDNRFGVLWNPKWETFRVRHLGVDWWEWLWTYKDRRGGGKLPVKKKEGLKPKKTKTSFSKADKTLSSKSTREDVIKYVKTNTDKLKTKYKGGKKNYTENWILILNTDDVRPFVWESKWLEAWVTHEWASLVTKALREELIKTSPKGSKVLILWWWGGSGKWFTLDSVIKPKWYKWIEDKTFSKAKNIWEYKALVKEWFKPEIAFVYSPQESAWKNALDRFLWKKSEGLVGRKLPYKPFSDAHVWVIDNMKALQKEWIPFDVYVNPWQGKWKPYKINSDDILKEVSQNKKLSKAQAKKIAEGYSRNGTKMTKQEISKLFSLMILFGVWWVATI